MRCAISLVLIEIVFMSKGDDQAKINVVGKLVRLSSKAK